MCGEGDLACLHLVGEHTAGETVGEVGGMPSPGRSSASHSVCLGTVEMEADGPVLTAVATLPLCAVEDCLLQHIFGLPAAVRWWGVCEIQTVEPQPWPLSIGLGCEPCDHG